jgi:glycosyltransferase involved in cell wall biosynthesis
MINVAIINPSPKSYSQTFINAHLQHINANKFILKKGYLPTKDHADQDLYKPSFPVKLLHKALIRTHLGTKESFQQKSLEVYLKKNKIDVVLAEFGPTGAAVYNICHNVNIPLVIHFHGADAYWDNYLKNLSTEYRKMFEVANKIFVVSKHMYQQLINLGAPEEKLIINTYGPADFFYDINPNMENPILISVGRFVDKKAPYLTILAFKEVLKHFPAACLYMVGDGELLFVCQNIVSSLKMESAVKFLGVKNSVEIAGLFQNAYCYVQHSIVSYDNDTEGTPVSILEASAAGLPVISTRHAGIPDVILHEKTGFIVDEGDIEKMSAYMLQLMHDRSLAKKMGTLGKEYIKNNYSMDKHISRLNEILLKACNNA